MKIEWDSLFAQPAIRRLVQLAQRSYGVRINFLDERGWLQGVEAGRFFNPANQLLATLSASEAGFRAKRDAAFRLAADVSNVRIPKRAVTDIGTSLVAVPLIIDGRYSGYVYADDFFETDRIDQQKVQFRNFYQRKVADLPDLQEKMGEIPVLSNSEVSYLIDILESVAEELTGSYAASAATSKEEAASSLINIPGFKNNYIIGTSSLVRELVVMLSRVAASDATVLVTGESGVGKELVARTLHENSRRIKKDFVAVNCGAFHEQLLESELFGHVKGAFTGATDTRMGYFERANGGTLFLDEIGETTLATQVKMLRFLQEGTFIPVGDSKEKSSNVRIVAATNRDLKQMMKRATFREDLFYRLRVIHVNVPSLRERREDIPLLVRHFIARHAESGTAPVVSDDTMEYLTGYHWPGNIRQLENEIKRLCVLSRGDAEILPDLLTDDIVEARKAKRELGKINESLKKTLDDREKAAIIEGLARTGGNKTRLARDLGMSRSLLATKIKKYGIAS
jgi:transcriptional regulator with PAS, ATPase and Fis domain